MSRLQGETELQDPGNRFSTIPATSDDFKWALHRTMTRLAQTCDKTPSTLYIQGVILQDRNPVGGGSFGDVYKGHWAGEAVAIKKMKVYARESVKKRTKRSKASCITSVDISPNLTQRF